MRYREPFTIFPRQLKSGRVVWYYQTYDEDGRRTTARSTGQTSKTKARWFCIDLLKTGSIIPDKKKDILFSQFAENFYVWGKCEYLKYRLRRMTLSKSYADSARSSFKLDILPYFKDKKLRSLTKRDAEQWITSLQDRGFQNSTINTRIGTFKTIMNEAVRRELIPKNPYSDFLKLKNNTRVRGILSTQEVQRLFDKSRIKELWVYPVYHLANLMAACTGMRIGEIRGLRCCDVHDGYINVSSQYKDKYGITETKTHKDRDIPLPPFLQKELDKIKNVRLEEDFIFILQGKNEPLGAGSLRKYLRRAICGIGINLEEQKKRNITFHSWRHFFNTTMRSNNISDSKVQKLTGHSSIEMTEHYTHFQRDDFKDVQKIQEKMLNLDTGPV